jgi:hypothetical protein
MSDEWGDGWGWGLELQASGFWIDFRSQASGLTHFFTGAALRAAPFQQSAEARSLTIFYRPLSSAHVRRTTITSTEVDRTNTTVRKIACGIRP